MKRAVVLIIAHKPELTENEISSLRQCHKVLGAYPIVIVCPEGMDISVYKRHVPSLDFHFIDPYWQSSYRKFNKLKISPLLYRSFENYEFILFYELDAWVFRDELEFWCDQDYDLVGAPWFEGFYKGAGSSTFIGVGNGGFSLRKVKSHLKVLRSFAYMRRPSELWARFWFEERSLRGFMKLVANLTVRNNTFYPMNNWSRNEDFFWGKIASERFSWFKVPDMLTASRFSMEVNAPFLFGKVGQQLPFGCHKWEVYHADFWKKYIQPVSERNREHT